MSNARSATPQIRSASVLAMAFILASCGGSKEVQSSTTASVTVSSESSTGSSVKATPSPAPTPAPTPDAIVPRFVMPSIAPPALPSGLAYETPQTIYSTSHSVDVSDRKIEGGTILLRADDVSKLTMSDIVARKFGPIMRGRSIDYITLNRIAVSQAKANATYGLGITNTSGGFVTAVMQNLVFEGDTTSPAPNAADAWAAIALKGKTSADAGNFTIDRFDFRDLWMASGSNYENVDGISTERGYSGTISNGRIVNASDACLDIKGDVTVDNVYLENCREGIKLWSSQSHGLIEMGTHRFVAIIAKGGSSNASTVYIETLILTGDPMVPAFRAEGGPVTLTIGTLVANPDQVLNASSSYAGSSVKVLNRIDF
jgi:hypothetical protein